MPDLPPAALTLAKRRKIMKKLRNILILGVVAALGVGTILLLTMEIPAPSKPVERTLSDDDFPR
ncbi:MAG: hypothetical protein IID51_06320 [Proteobacteria bacterium]|nr:hypothetical protein [Pseudomonadota bacterium]